MHRLRAFLKSPHHAWLGLGTLGLGLATAQPLFALLGAAAYALGWIYLPDSQWFTKWLTKKEAAAKPAQRALLQAEQRRLFQELTSEGQRKYQQLVAVTREIESHLRDSRQSGNLDQLDALMWTYLRLLRTEETLRDFLNRDPEDAVVKDIADAEGEIASMRDEMAKHEAEKALSAALNMSRVLDSKVERLDALRQRAQRLRETRANVDLAYSERQRLEERLKLIRADVLASSDPTNYHLPTEERLVGMQDWLAQVAPPLPEGLDRVLPSAVSGRVGYDPLSSTTSVASRPQEME